MPREVSKTSLKGMFQGLATKGAPDVVLGIVKQTNPLQVQVMNDEKLLLNEEILYIPEHLTDHEVEITLNDWNTEQTEVRFGPLTQNHSHTVTASGNTDAAQITLGEYSGSHSHSVTVNGNSSQATVDFGILSQFHSHELVGTKKITIHNGLKVGDVLHLLSFATGKQYFALGRAKRGE